MTVTEIWGVKFALKQSFQSAEFRDVLDELEGQYPGGITLASPFKVYTAEKNILDGYPAVELLGLDSNPVGDTSAQDYEHRISVVFTALGDDEELVTARIECYIVAARRLTYRGLLVQVVGAPPNVPGRERYGPLIRNPSLPEPFIKAGSIDLLISTIEG